MIIEIRNAGFINKGAELMLHAVMHQIKDRYPYAKLVMAPSHPKKGRPFYKFAKLGFYSKAWFWKYGIQCGDAAVLVPKLFRDMYGVVLDREVNVVLDMAGFAYSDQWGVGSSKELARSSKRWKRRGTKVILLPQALGPYQKSDIQSWVIQWADNVDLIFAREHESYNHLTELVGEQNKIKIYPDFTNLVKGTLPDGYDSSDKRIALVPNYRMVDKTNKEESAAYLPFMIRCAKYLVAQDAKPFVLVHEGANDQMLADRISEAAGGIPVVKENDALHIKGILGTCDATVGSRFHGLVSALSQGVPSLATGWSHKYIRLFDDYSFKEGVVSVLSSEQELYNKIDLILNVEKLQYIRNGIIDCSNKQKELSRKMWMSVFEEMDKVANR
ncbi:polysaccharide pyruvyl transferase family protein [Natronospirillum operosum]|uniref:Polysaccharide pyruvyl transferase family protein n=1 Tax=Natronospirillum operosum TaxID=2759953 RepID=A0A4Z0WIJ3_9GAMM|nr:polysaccharide pyruvyl transferase family protein [Natronospirillum operosum]TGG95253.1 polysaccharide pyruvyl transferase family protein [Natronospirillum operosum]